MKKVKKIVCKSCRKLFKAIDEYKKTKVCYLCKDYIK